MARVAVVRAAPDAIQRTGRPSELRRIAALIEVAERIVMAS
jgi:hypothetical protein